MVVLVDRLGDPIGVRSKAEVHGESTPQHLAFSCHVVDEHGHLLVTRRALEKRTWPGVWTNSLCGHPAPGEAFEDAIHRRAGFELGLTVDHVVCAIPDFSYSARDTSGIEENEYCPVFIARAASILQPNPSEVAETQWTTAVDLAAAIDAAPWAFSPWMVDHFPELEPHLAKRLLGVDDNV